MPSQNLNIRGTKLNFEFTDEADLIAQATIAENILIKEQMRGETALADVSTGRLLLDQASQGATFGFSDEARAFLGSSFAKGTAEVADFLGIQGFGDLADREFGEIFDEALARERINLQAQQEAEPALALAANIAGGLVTGIGGAATKGGKALGRVLATGGIGARTAKAGVAGGVSGALFGAGAVEEDRLAGATGGIIPGALGGGLIPGGAALGGVVARKTGDVVKSIGRRIGVLAEEGALQTPQLASKAVKDLAATAYKVAEEEGGTLNARFTNKFLKRVRKELAPQTPEGQLLAGDEPFTNIIENLQQLKGQPISLQGLQEIDEFLTRAVSKNAPVGVINKDGLKILDIQTILREEVESASKTMTNGTTKGFAALKEGRKLWSASKKLEDIESILSRAEIANRPDTAIKSGFRSLAN